MFKVVFCFIVYLFLRDSVSDWSIFVFSSFSFSLSLLLFPFLLASPFFLSSLLFSASLTVRLLATSQQQFNHSIALPSFRLYSGATWRRWSELWSRRPIRMHVNRLGLGLFFYLSHSPSLPPLARLAGRISSINPASVCENSYIPLNRATYALKTTSVILSTSYRAISHTCGFRILLCWEKSVDWKVGNG